MRIIEGNLSEKIYSVGHVFIDGSFHTQSANEAFFGFFGNDAIYSIKRIIDGEDFERLAECIRNVKAGTALRTVIRVIGVDGAMHWVSAVVRLAEKKNSEQLYSIEFHDIASLEKIAAASSRKLSDYRYMLSLVNDLAFVYSFETKRIKIFMFDCCRDIAIIDEPLEKWQEEAINSGYVPTRYIENFNSLCRDIKNGVYRFEHEFESSLMTKGKIRELCLFRGITRFLSPKSKTVTGIISVISSKQKAKDINFALEANKDSLSGLLNKRAVNKFASNILASSPSYNVNFVILDIDNFTEINSSYGHLFGDEVIYTIAGIVKKEIGTRGIAGRISGGGFFIVLEDTRNEEDLRSILRAVRTNTEFAFNDRFQDFRITCSMGISTYPVDSEDCDELFMMADKALYIAQQKGGNRYVIYDVEKHGSVEKDIENKIAFLNIRKDTTEKLNFVAELSESLVFGRTPDISVLLEQVRSEFAIDDICVFAGNNAELILSCGNAVSRNALYLFENDYTEHFSGDGIFAIDNVNELEGRDDKAFHQLTEENIGGAVQYLMTEDGMIKGMISFCYIGRFKKWSDSDMNYLAILGRIITAILRKQAFI